MLWSIVSLVLVTLLGVVVVLYNRRQAAIARAQATPSPRSQTVEPPAQSPAAPSSATTPSNGKRPASPVPTTTKAPVVKPAAPPAEAKAQKKPAPVATAVQDRPKAKPAPEETGLDVMAEAKKAAGPMKPETTPPPMTAAAPGDSAKHTALKRELAEARAAMAERQLKLAHEHLTAARAHAQSGDEQAQIDRLETLLHDLTEFWKGMGQILASLQPTEEIAIGEQMAIVVSADARELTIRREGRNETYSLQQLPHELAVALAQARFAKSASSRVLLGAYLAVDPEGDRALARQLWEQAGKEGEDVADLLAELGGSGAAAPSKTAPPADPARLAQAEASMKQSLKTDFEQAGSGLRKAELAKKLLERARTTAETPELQYVMLREACEQAAAAGKAALACLVVDQMARYYTVDELALKTAALDKAAKAAHGLQGYKEVAEQTLKLVEQAAAAGRSDEAKRLLAGAMAAAQKAKNINLVQRVRAVAQQLGQ